MLRRTFLKSATIALNGAIGLGLAIPGLRYLLHPLRSRVAAAAFAPVAKLSALAAGKPTRVPVVAEHVDSFTRNAARPIGSVWLLREEQEGAEPRVHCWQVICPHLGCGIDFIHDRKAFSCPCHASEFDLKGVRKYGPSPRDMDQLECRVTPADAAGERWVEIKYERFQTGLSNRQAIA